MVFNCTGQFGAFMVHASVSATPAFTLPTNATDLYAFPAYEGNWPSTCAAFPGAVGLTSGTSVTFSTNGSWDYCVDATGSLPGFSVTWSD